MLSGTCLCGAVRYETSEAPAFVFNCYCATCRRESGAGHVTIVSVGEKGFKVSGEIKIVAPTRANEAPPIPRSFCPACGSTLFARPPGMPGFINLRAGTLDGNFDLDIQRSFFASLSQPWDKPPDDIPTDG
jgi:hypothetical protein